MSVEADLEALGTMAKTLRGLANESTGLFAGGASPTLAILNSFGVTNGISGALRSVSEATNLSVKAQKTMREAMVERLDDVSSVMRSVAAKYKHTDNVTAEQIAQAYSYGLPEWKAPRS